MSVAIGIDLGGGSVKYAVVDRGGHILWPDNKIPARIPYDNDVNDPIDLAIPSAALEEAIRLVPGDRWKVDAVGIAATGLVNADGKVVYGVSFRDYRNQDWSLIPKRLGYNNTHVTHDVRAAAWAEYIAQGKPSNTMLHVTLGTGLGAACIMDGRFFYGADYAQGEIGYMALLNPLTDRTTCLLCENANDGTALGAGLTTLIHLINPKHVVLAGLDPRRASQAVQFFRKNTLEVYNSTSIEVDVAVPVDVRRQAWEAYEARGAHNLEPFLYVAQDSRGHLSSVLVYGGTIVDFCNDPGEIYVYAPQKLELDVPFVYLEKYSGALGIEALFELATGLQRPFKDIADGAQTDLIARRTLERAGRMLGAGLVTAVRIFKPQLITLGGAIPSLAPIVKDAAVEFLATALGQRLCPQIEVGKYRNEAGVIGAALYALSKA